jgi:hypothetical protein
MKSIPLSRPVVPRTRRLAQQLLRVAAGTVALFVIGAWASELVWALVGASLVLTLGDPA